MQSSLDAARSFSPLAVRVAVALALATAAVLPVIHGAAWAQAPGQAQRAAQPRFSVDSSIGTLAADARAKAIVDKYAPGLTSGPHYLMAAAFSIRQIKSRMSGMISEAKFNQMQKELTRLR